MTLSPITDKQVEMLLLLYKFRFLTTRHFQLLLNHKNPKRIQIWLKDLKDKQYIATFPRKDTFTDKSKPYIYHLASKSRYILNQYKVFDASFFERIYAEKKKKEPFINFCLALVSAYLIFLSKKKPDETLYFLTASDLAGYDYLPDPQPSAYIAVKNGEETKRYFFELFYSYATAPVLRARFQSYLKYASSGIWEANEEDKPLPTLLFICPSNRLKNHIKFYAEGVFKKSYEEKIKFFVTSQSILLQSNGENIWEKVTIADQD